MNLLVSPSHDQYPITGGSQASVSLAPTGEAKIAAQPCVARHFTARLHFGIEALETLWCDWQEAGRCTAFQRFEWISSLVKNLVRRDKSQPLIVVISETASNEPVMLVPLVLRRRYGVRVIEWLGLGVCDYAAPVLAPGVEFRVSEANMLWSAVRSALPPADLIRIKGIPEHIRGAANPFACLVGVREADQKAFSTEIEGDPETLLKRVCGSSFLRNLQKEKRRLAKIGEVKFVAAKTNEEVEEIFSVLLEQRRRRFEEMGRFNFIAQPAVSAFYKDAAISGLNAGGGAKIFGLSVNGEWIATAYCLVHQKSVTTVMSGMAGQSWQAFSPGVQIMAQTMIWAREHGHDCFDLSVGDLSYKKEMGMRTQELLDFCEPLTLRGVLSLELDRIQINAKGWLRRKSVFFDHARRVRRAIRKGIVRLTAFGSKQRNG